MASPHPDKELDRLHALCARALPAIVVLAGKDRYFRTTALERVLAVVPERAELVTLDGQATEGRGRREDAAAMADADADPAGADDGDGDDAERESVPVARCPDLEPLAGGGLFAQQAFVVVRRAERWLQRFGAAVAAFVPRIKPGSVLVLETARLDKRTRLWKDLQQHGAVFDFRELYETPFGRPDRPLEGELVQWVVQRSKKLAVQLAPESALLLVAQIGKQPGDLLAELQQLSLRLPKDPQRKPLQPGDLRGSLTCSFESTPFELAEAVLAGDRRRAERSLQAMFARGVGQKDGRRMDQGGLFPFGTSWLFSSLGQVHEGRRLLDDGVDLRDVPGRVGVAGFTERYQEQVRTNALPRLEHGLLALLHTQRERRLTGEDDLVLLERWLARWFDALPLPLDQELAW